MSCQVHITVVAESCHGPCRRFAQIMVKNILITGRPGVGKTTVIKRVISTLDLKPGGFYTEEIREGRVRKGFRIKTFSGKSGILAHADNRSGPRVGKYGVDMKSFESTALPELEHAIGNRELVVIDEIGKMELFSHRFKDLVLKSLDGPAPVLGVIMESGNGFISDIQQRKDVRLFRITLGNRDTIVPDILKSVDELT